MGGNRRSERERAWDLSDWGPVVTALKRDPALHGWPPTSVHGNVRSASASTTSVCTRTVDIRLYEQLQLRLCCGCDVTVM